MNGSYQGEVRGLSGYLLHGWVWNPAAPDERVVLEVYLKGVSLGCTVANIFEADLREARIGDGVHGFVFSLSLHAREHAGTLRIRIANTDQWLSTTRELESNDERLESQVYYDGGLGLSGWASNLSDDEPVKVRITCGDAVAEDLTADAFALHAPEASKFSGFKFTLPLALADGNTHQVRITTGGDKHLRGSPLTIACFPEGESAVFAELASQELEHSAAAQLLTQVLEENRHYVPRSLDFDQYPAWFELFGTPRHEIPRSSLKFDLRQLGSGDAARTSKSLAAQTHTLFNWNGAGDYVVIIGAGDTLPPWALAAVAEALEQAGNPGLLYTDCDWDGEDGQRSKPWFKPGWDPDLFCQQNYLAPLCVIRSDIAKQYASASPQALPYLAARHCLAKHIAIRHLPLVCYHHAHDGQNNSKSWEDFSARDSYQHAVQWNSPVKEAPLVSIIIPTRDQVDYLRTVINSLHTSTYPELEIIVVDNQSSEADTLAYLKEIAAQGERVLKYDQPFNFAAMNNFAVQHATGAVICLLNNDVEVITEDWLEQMVALLMRPDTGVVGAKLLWPNNMVQHGGVILGLNKVAGHYGNACTDEDAGYFDHNQTVRRVSGVTAACLVIRKADYLAVNGFDTVDFPVGFNDVDLCLKVQRDLGKAVVWTPHAKLYHFESVSRGKEDLPEKQARAQREIDALRRHWAGELLCDPAYNPNLSLSALAGAHQGLALPPRTRNPR